MTSVPAQSAKDISSSNTVESAPVPTSTTLSTPPKLALSSSPASNAMPSIKPQPDISSLEAVTLNADLNELSLSQKLVKALCLAHLGLHRGVQREADIGPLTATGSKRQFGVISQEDWFPPSSFGHPTTPIAPRGAGRYARSTSDASSVLPGMNTADYSTLIEVLASALKDVSSQPWLWQYRPESVTEGTEESEDEASEDDECSVARANAETAEPQTESASLPLAIDVVVSEETSSSIDTGAPAQATSITSDAASSSKSAVLIKDMPSVILENLTSLVDMLRPPTQQAEIAKQYSPNLDAFDPTLFGSNSTEASNKSPKTAALISQIPPETLTRILTMARAASEENACECGQACSSSRVAFQKWSLNLATVCKAWKAPAQSAAYGITRVRSRMQIAKLSATLSTAPEIAGYIAELDIKVPAFSSSASSGNTHPYLGGRAARTRAAAFPWFQAAQAHAQPSSPSMSISSPSDSDEVEIPEQQLAKFVETCTGLSKIELNVSRTSSYSYGGGWPYASDFLERGLQAALGASKCLRSLTLRQCIDWGELEAILLESSTLQDLRFEGGIDNLDGRDDALEEQHQCRLKSLYINNWESVDIGEEQLCWIIRPSAGSLRSLEIATSVGLTAAGMAGGNTFPPYSGAAFADVLVNIGPTLTRLALKDSLGQGLAMGGAAQNNPTLRNPPHDGALDYALGHCQALTELAIEWPVTGPLFLESIKNAPITNLVLIGSPTATSGRDFQEQLLNGFSGLKKLTLAYLASHQAGSWSAREVRSIRNACDKRHLSFDFSSA